jgi:thymidylate synthase (FAD)
MAKSRRPKSKDTEEGAPKIRQPPRRLARQSSNALDTLLGFPFRVLDSGFVRIVDYMGDDASIVQAARVSYGEGTKQIHGDRGLIRYLMRHSHTTPFEMCEIKLHVRAPMDVWRQWIRHRTASVNEYSTRYSIAIDAVHATAKDEWRGQGVSNRQGSDVTLPLSVGSKLSADEKNLHDLAREIYDSRISAGVAREQARKDLPLSTYTEAYWKIDLHNLLHFLQLRMDAHAQDEIRAYATAIGQQIVSKWVPLTWEAFIDYRRESVRLSRLELGIIRALIEGRGETAHAIAASAGFLQPGTGTKLAANRERAELEEKLIALGLSAPW